MYIPILMFKIIEIIKDLILKNNNENNKQNINNINLNIYLINIKKSIDKKQIKEEKHEI